MSKPKYLYRTFFKKYLDAYKNNPNVIPDLEGRNFKQFKDLNPFPYEDDRKYLHFFDTRYPVKQYAEDLERELDEETCIAIFQFDDSIVEQCRTLGKFRVSNVMCKEFNEYIIPLELYDPKKHFVGLLEPAPSTKKPNVYAILQDNQIEHYATNLSQADGFEYVFEEQVARLVEGQQKVRAVHLYSSKDEAQRVLSADPEFEFDHDIVPFSVDSAILQQYRFNVPGSRNAHYLVPLSELSEENYVEQGKAEKPQIAYDPDDYSEYKWF